MNSNPVRRQIQQEADLLERFIDSYRKRLGNLIERLNGHGAPVTDMQCLRLCVEAVDMILSSQTQLARAMTEMSAQTTLRAAA